MAYQSSQIIPECQQPSDRRWLTAFAGWIASLRTPYPRLDVEAIDDHMKRDLGFKDGRDPRYDRSLAR
ncbi:hypothetical protein [Sinorhizobium sp. BG8]|uniref:hypothetical protein n=1 Tax=Sinorhizobium sp. BG8 TaxID=2613773 RepID=UPI00193D0D72|nr:hypothetical protein [Sinorhizobium sp. BG8]QRM56365.1 hypothetical protein F3Y30_18850 [Sinorhizobium sp. BG8]